MRKLFKKDKKGKGGESSSPSSTNSTPSPSLTASRNPSIAITKDFSGPEIRPDDIDIVKTLSAGKQGAVYKAIVFHHEVAVKEILFDKDKKPEVQIENFRAEVKMMSEIHHPNICLFLGACLVESKWRLVTELCKCDLDSILSDKKRFVTFSLFDKIEMAKDIAMGMAWLHELGIVHLDLKPKNILVDKHGILKIADFGYSRLLTNTHNLFLSQEVLVAGGSPLYMSPERLLNSRNYSKSSDVYSFAIILWEILTGSVPFENHSEINEFKVAVVKRGERPPVDRIAKTCGESALRNKPLIELLTNMWDADADKRPIFREIVTKLDKLLVAAAVSDEGAKRFWVENFYKSITTTTAKTTKTFEELRVSVPWTDFTSALYQALKPSFKKEGFTENEIIEHNPPKKLLDELNDNPTDAELRSSTPKALDIFRMRGEKEATIVHREKVRREWVVKIMRLRVMIIDSNKNVHITRFGKICDTLGPWDIGTKNQILDTISSLMRQSWFYGYLSKDDAYEKLKDKPEGTFLIRFGATQNRFVISRVVMGRSEKKVVHNRIKHEPGQGFSLPGRKTWKTLEQLVEGERQTLQFIYKPEHPIAQLGEDSWWGNDIATNASYYYDEEDDYRGSSYRQQQSSKDDKKEVKKVETPAKKSEPAPQVKQPSAATKSALTSQTIVDALTKELDEMQRRQQELLAKVSQGPSDELYKAMGEIYFKIETLKKAIEAAKKS